MKNNNKNVNRKHKSTDSFSVAPKPQKGNITIDIPCVDGSCLTFYNLTQAQADELIARAKAYYKARFGVPESAFSVKEGAA